VGDSQTAGGDERQQQGDYKKPYDCPRATPDTKPLFTGTETNPILDADTWVFVKSQKDASILSEWIFL
jgi:hypothetical protein